MVLRRFFAARKRRLPRLSCPSGFFLPGSTVPCGIAAGDECPMERNAAIVVPKPAAHNGSAQEEIWLIDDTNLREPVPLTDNHDNPDFGSGPFRSKKNSGLPGKNPRYRDFCGLLLDRKITSRALNNAVRESNPGLFCADPYAFIRMLEGNNTWCFANFSRDYDIHHLHIPVQWLSRRGGVPPGAAEVIGTGFLGA